MSEKYHCLPSKLLNIEDDYLAYCFNEACCYILTMLQNGEEPQYEEKKKKQPEHYNSFSDFYKDIGG